MEPLISLQVCQSPNHVFRPGETLACEYQLDAVDPDEILAVEESVLWFTEGKGDDDLDVHYFQRRTPGEDEPDLRSLRRFEVQMPRSPLSYAGVILKIRWCARIRVFLKRGRQVSMERVVQLGHVPAPPRPEPVVAANEES